MTRVGNVEPDPRRLTATFEAICGTRPDDVDGYGRDAPVEADFDRLTALIGEGILSIEAEAVVAKPQ